MVQLVVAGTYFDAVKLRCSSMHGGGSTTQLTTANVCNGVFGKHFHSLCSCYKWPFLNGFNLAALLFSQNATQGKHTPAVDVQLTCRNITDRL